MSCKGFAEPTACNTGRRGDVRGDLPPLLRRKTPHRPDLRLPHRGEPERNMLIYIKMINL